MIAAIDKVEARILQESISDNRVYTNHSNIYGLVQFLCQCFRKDDEHEVDDDTMRAGLQYKPSELRKAWRSFIRKAFIQLYNPNNPNPAIIFPNLDPITNLEVFVECTIQFGQLLSNFLFFGRTYLVYVDQTDLLERTINLWTSQGTHHQPFDIL